MWCALDEGVSYEAFPTLTCGRVILARAHSSQAAHVTERARVLTSVLNAGLAARTLPVAHALHPTPPLRVAPEVVQTGAHGPAAHHRADGVEPARARVTRVVHFHGLDGRTSDERVPAESMAARTHGVVFLHLARRAKPARAQARVATPEPYAGLRDGAVVVHGAFRP